MTIEQIKQNIRFNEVPLTQSTVMLVGRLELSRAVTYDAEKIKKQHPKAVDQMKEQIVERLLRLLYENRFMEVDRALRELILCEPYDYSSIAEKKDKLVRLVLRMPPAGAESQMQK